MGRQSRYTTEQLWDRQDARAILKSEGKAKIDLPLAMRMASTGLGEDYWQAWLAIAYLVLHA